MNNNKLIGEVDGQKKEYDIYFTFVCHRTNKGYIAYTDHTLGEHGKETLYVSTYDPNIGYEQLGTVETQEEWDLINSVIEKIKKISKEN